MLSLLLAMSRSTSYIIIIVYETLIFVLGSRVTSNITVVVKVWYVADYIRSPISGVGAVNCNLLSSVSVCL
jgi:hypothetical protein